MIEVGERARRALSSPATHGRGRLTPTWRVGEVPPRELRERRNGLPAKNTIRPPDRQTSLPLQLVTPSFFLRSPRDGSRRRIARVDVLPAMPPVPLAPLLLVEDNADDVFFL